jgi:hypothetical protein
MDFQIVKMHNDKVVNKNVKNIFLKKWWVESDFKAPNLPLSLLLKGSGCHYNSIYNNTGKVLFVILAYKSMLFKPFIPLTLTLLYI